MGPLIAQLFQVLAVAAVREGVGDNAISEILIIASSLITRGVSAQSELQALTTQVETMVNEDREPTAEEWQALKGRSDAAHDAIQNADLSDN